MEEHERPRKRGKPTWAQVIFRGFLVALVGLAIRTCAKKEQANNAPPMNQEILAQRVADYCAHAPGDGGPDPLCDRMRDR
jgi:hypothetical protein